MSEHDLLIVVDVGNTNTVCGVFEGEKGVADFRLSTDIDRTADEYAALLLPLFTKSGIDPADAADKKIRFADRLPDTPGDLQPLNQTFGRQFKVVSFRWLNENEI